MKRVSPNEVVIFGAAGHAKVAADILMLSGYKVIAFIGKKGERGKILGVAVLEETGPAAAKLLADKNMDYFVAIGDNRIREKVTARLQKLLKRKPVNAVHPDAVISQYTEIGTGNFINCGVKINAGARIGNSVCINTSATVDHDCVFEDFSHLGPGAHLAGRVRVGRYASVWTGAVVIPKIFIGRDAVVGAGACVIRNVKTGDLVAGVPAKSIANKK